MGISGIACESETFDALNKKTRVLHRKDKDKDHRKLGLNGLANSCKLLSLAVTAPLAARSQSRFI